MSENQQAPTKEESEKTENAIIALISDYATEEKTFREDLVARTQVILTWLKDNGIGHVCADYDGGGDSGDVNSVQMRMCGKEEAENGAYIGWDSWAKLTEEAQQKLFDNLTPQIKESLNIASKEALTPNHVTVAIGNLCWDWSMYVAGFGWYNDDGGQGTVTLFPYRDENRVTVAHSNRVTIYEDTTEEAL